MERYGAACGRAIAGLRRLHTEPSPRESFTLHGGFVYRFTREELEALARSVGRELVWEDDETDYPHATFLRV
jgi:hypothetical protein